MQNKEQNYCDRCGVEVEKAGELCVDCISELEVEIDHPSYEE